MSHLLHVFPLIRLHELTPITDAYRWNAHDHLEQAIRGCLYGGEPALLEGLALFGEILLLWSSLS